MSAFTQGEKVKVTFEGTIEATPNDEWVGVRLDDGLIHWVHADERVAKVEKVEPEHEVFGPGDLIRHRSSGSRYLVGRDGYYSFLWDKWYPWGLDQPSFFTTHYYERVEV